MRRSLPYFRLLALGSAAGWAVASAGTSQPLPTPYPEARYHQMSTKSPFAVASASSAATPVPTPGFASQLYLDGVAHVGGTDYVAIKSKDATKPLAIFLTAGTPGQDGLKVERVEWSDKSGKTKVDVSKGGEKATLEFDQAQIASVAASQPPPVLNQFARPPFGGIRRRPWPGFSQGDPQGQIVPGASNRTDIH